MWTIVSSSCCRPPGCWLWQWPHLSSLASTTCLTATPASANWRTTTTWFTPRSAPSSSPVPSWSCSTLEFSAGCSAGRRRVRSNCAAASRPAGSCSTRPSPPPSLRWLAQSPGLCRCLYRGSSRGTWLSLDWTTRRTTCSMRFLILDSTERTQCPRWRSAISCTGRSEPRLTTGRGKLWGCYLS